MFKELWNDKSVSGNMLKIIIAIWAVGIIVLAINNFIKII